MSKSRNHRSMREHDEEDILTDRQTIRKVEDRRRRKKLQRALKTMDIETICRDMEE